MKTLEIEVKGRVAAQMARQLDLRKFMIALAPENSPILLIHIFNRCVFFPQPVLESVFTGGAKADWTPKFVIELPAHHIWVIGIVPGHGERDFLRKQPIGSTGKTVDLAIAKVLALSVPANGDSVWIFVVQPLWHGGRRGAD